MRKKMIEVAIPLDAINKESAREKSIRHGHPSTMHLWWARRPLAACRAVIFASLVDDPDSDPSNWTEHGAVDAVKASFRRKELFDLIERLVRWEATNDESVLTRARAEIASSLASHKVHDAKEWTCMQIICGEPVTHFLNRTATPDNVFAFLAEHAPPVLDPFAGGGSIPLEAQRLGLRAYASDLNPVPVLLNKALIELPPQFANNCPVNPEQNATSSPQRRGGVSRKDSLTDLLWSGAKGLSDDVRYYGKWMRKEADDLIGNLYPKVHVTPAMVVARPDLAPYVDEHLTVIAWIWARTVPSPDPAASLARSPLIRSFWLSKKKGKEAYAVPVIDHDALRLTFRVCVGKPTKEFDPSEGTVGRTGAKCVFTGSPIALEWIREQGKAAQLGEALIAIVAEGKKGRVYLSPTDAHQRLASDVGPTPDAPDTQLPKQALGFRVQNYGLIYHSQLFSARQLKALVTFSQLVGRARDKCLTDSGGNVAYANAVATYLAFAVGRAADKWANLTVWNTVGEKIEHVFGRNALSMTWDFPEGNVFSDSTGNWESGVEWVCRAIEHLPARGIGRVQQQAAQSVATDRNVLLSTDPPYYDNVPYADLSDFFYVWLRMCLKDYYPELLSTVLVPKAEELVAEPFRHGGRDAARSFFEGGMATVFKRAQSMCDSLFPATIYYAFKQAEESDGETDEEATSVARISTGWETFLQALIVSGWQIVGTWPLRTERPGRLRDQGSNALASSIVLVCRNRAVDAPITSRRDFVHALKRELPSSLRELQASNIAPVDLAQAAIGPGIGIYSRYSRVVEAGGEPLTVRTALALINQVLDEVLAEQEGDYDADTRWSLKWFEQFAQEDGPFGDANTLATAVSIGINGLVDTGIVQAKAGKVRLLRRTELMNGHPDTWDPATDTDIVHWEVCQYLIHALDTKGEAGAAALLRRINARYPGASETARELAYRLYTICERKKWAQEAMAYNSLIVAWPEIVKLAQSSDGSGGEAQTTMF